jgi:hypothetical protein
MRSAMPAAKAISCVTISIDMSLACASSRTTQSTSPTSSRSSANVTSSNSMILGFSASEGRWQFNLFPHMTTIENVREPLMHS